MAGLATIYRGSGMTRGHDPTTQPPRDRRALQRFDDALEDLTRLSHQLHRTLATYHDWAERGYPADTIPETVSGGHPTSKAPRDVFKTKAAQGYEEIHDAVDAIDSATTALLNKVTMVTDPPVRGLGLPGCRSCRRIPDHDHAACRAQSRDRKQPLTCPGEPWWQPIYVQADQLCRWCWEFRQRWDQIPPEPILEARRDGRKITTRLIEQHLDAA